MQALREAETASVPVKNDQGHIVGLMTLCEICGQLLDCKEEGQESFFATKISSLPGLSSLCGHVACV